MPSEIRHIKFEKEEVLRSVVEYWKWKKEAHDPDNIEDFSLVSEPEIAARIRFYNAENGREIMLHADILSTAIVLFCINRKIPLPVNARKSIRLFRDELILIVNLGKTHF